MIITKTPFRISFCGGGSDLPSFYTQHAGCVLSTSINKYMYISIHPYFFKDTTVLKYSQTEIVKDIRQIDHKILKFVLNKFGLQGVEITSTADVPSGTGLGSSSSFTVGLLNTINVYLGKYASKGRLAEEACHIEIEELGNPIGKQDHYAASFGGLNYIRFNRDGSVSVEPLVMMPQTYKTLDKNLLMFYTGDVRSANAILFEQNKNMKDKDKVSALVEMCKLTEQMREALQNNDTRTFAQFMHESWLLKKTLASGISNPEIDHLYDVGMKNGALGGKLLGAGGGGFLMFYCQPQNQNKLRSALALKEMDFSFDHAGTSVLFVGDKYWN